MSSGLWHAFQGQGCWDIEIVLVPHMLLTPGPWDSLNLGKTALLLPQRLPGICSNQTEFALGLLGYSDDYMRLL